MANLSQDELRLQINYFLKDFKELVYQGQYSVKGHLKNIEALSQLGLTSRQRDECILSLSLSDYCQGPVTDTMHAGHYWVFGKFINNIEIYIKLKVITYNNGNETAVCISFHPSESPLSYPLT